MTPHPCPHAPRCVPCPLRGRPYRAQLAWKRDLVAEAFRASSELRAVDVPAVSGARELFGYRNVVKLAVRGRSGRLRAGVYEPGTHVLANAAECAVHHPALRELISSALELGDEIGIEPYDEKNHQGELRFLAATYSRWHRRSRLTLVTRTRGGREIRELARRLSRRFSSALSVLQNIHPERGNRILGDSWKVLCPPGELIDRVGLLKLRVSPGSFLQANLPVAGRIYRRALSDCDLEPGSTAVDLYTGVGALALHLAGVARHVVGLEEVDAAILDAKSNARRNGISNTRFYAGPVEDRLPNLRLRAGQTDVLTLNPPRRGATPRVLDEIGRLSPRRIVYVSCHPGTLARDLGRLVELGFRLRAVQPFDLLPQSEHVEVVASLVRSK